MKALKLGSAVLAAALVALLAVSIYATELTRLFVRRVAVSPLALPAGVDLRYSDRLVAIIGKGSGGTARAVTVGHVIVVRTNFDQLTDRQQRRIIRHELAHVKQRTHYGRFYLLVYGIQYLRHGYRNHPLEREAYRVDRRTFTLGRP